MSVNLYVSPIWDPTGEDCSWYSNIYDFTKEDEDLENLLFLGAHLGSNINYHVDLIRFDHNWHTGYIGVIWQGHIELCGFQMHLTLAKWHAFKWRREACFSCEEGIKDMGPVYQEFEKWRIKWSPRLLEIDRLETSAVIGTRKFDGGWRTIMKPRDKLLKKQLYDAKGQLDNWFAIGPFNQVTELHFSLDHWWGYYPSWIKERVY